MSLLKLAPFILPLAFSPLFAQAVSNDSAPSNRPARRWVTTVSSGFADCFQLTLGGMFGEGPAWQTKVTTGVSNAIVSGDMLYLHGWNTHDSPSHSNDWMAGLAYKAPVWKHRDQFLSLGTGFYKLRFPSVKTGVNDWMIPINLQYQAKPIKLPILVTSDAWTLPTSTLQRGTLLHTQGWFIHPLLKRDDVQVQFRHGPAHTHSWGFWGTNGERIWRYQTMLVISWKNTSLEGGYRKQWGQQPGMQNNTFWQFALTRTFTM
ncbi:MAG: hypothetical protein J0H49_16080 [Acidobacteria bacterium]|nr:hypothetical protein [Acidobacteriota bacterium]